jgi:hypothetical protein
MGCMMLWSSFSLFHEDAMTNADDDGELFLARLETMSSASLRDER